MNRRLVSILVPLFILAMATVGWAVEFSQPGGFYAEELNLELSSKEPEMAIYYTLDGSKPDPENISGTTYYIKQSYPHGGLEHREYRTYRYTGAITIGDRSHTQGKLAQINTTFHEDFYIPTGSIPQATVVRAMAVDSSGQASPLVTQTYFVGQGVYVLPIISLATNEDSLFDYHQGIYVPGQAFDQWRIANPDLPLFYQRHGANYEMRGGEGEKEGHVAFFEADGQLAFGQDLGIRTHGGWTRSYQRKSLRIYPRNEYGDLNRINYEIFPGLTKKGGPSTPLEVFNRLILRNSGNDDGVTLFRDGLLQQLVSHLSFDTQGYRPAILFINGEYWGIFNIRERYDDYYFHSHYGLDRDQVVLLSNHATIEEGTEEDRQDFFNLRRYINREDMAVEEHYRYVEQLMDIDNFIEYHLSNIYFGNTDWPGNNISYWRKRIDQYDPEAPHGHDGRWRWALYDTDFGFGLRGGVESASHNTLAFAVERGGPVWPNPEWSTVMLRSMLESPVFSYRFINAFADNLNTSFKPKRVLALIEEMKAVLEPEMENHIERWGRPSSLEEWQENIEVMRQFSLERPHYVWQHLQEHFDLSNTVRVTLNTNSDRGNIQINTIRIADGTPGVEDPNLWTGQYFEGVPIELTAIPKPGYRFVTWVGGEGGTNPSFTQNLTEDLSIIAVFVPDENDPPVVIPDGALKKGIYQALGKALDEAIYASELANLKVLNLRGQGIKNLQGLEYAINLVDLDLRENKITDIGPLAGLVKLERLTIRENRIEDISPLANLVRLRDLSIHSNGVEDITVLANLVELEELTLRGNRISDIRPLANLSRLKDLNIRDNEITDLSPLGGLENIRGKGSRLNLAGNIITDFSPMAHYYELIEDVDFEITSTP